jgi:hypothetical protein
MQPSVDAEGGACASSCVRDQTSCVSGGIATCLQGPDGCWAYGTTVACQGYRQTCSDDAGTASCACNIDPVCKSVANVCTSSATAASCAQDNYGCLYEMATATCSGSTPYCNGAGVCGACEDGTTQCHGTTLQTCSGGNWVSGAVGTQIGPHSAVTGWPKRVPFRDAPLARDGPLPLLTRRGTELEARILHLSSLVRTPIRRARRWSTRQLESVVRPIWVNRARKVRTAYLTDVLARVQDHPASSLDELLPGAWSAAAGDARAGVATDTTMAARYSVAASPASPGLEQAGLRAEADARGRAHTGSRSAWRGGTMSPE